MILSKRDEFSDAQAITGSAYSTNVQDLGAQPRHIGAQTPLSAVVGVVTEFDSSGDTVTVDVQLVTSDNADLSSHTVLAATGPLAQAALTAGAMVFNQRLPDTDYKRYLGFRYVIASGPATAGAVDAYLTPDVQKYRPGRKNYVSANG